MAREIGEGGGGWVGDEQRRGRQSEIVKNSKNLRRQCRFDERPHTNAPGEEIDIAVEDRLHLWKQDSPAFSHASGLVVLLGESEWVSRADQPSPLPALQGPAERPRDLVCPSRLSLSFPQPHGSHIGIAIGHGPGSRIVAAAAAHRPLRAAPANRVVFKHQ